MKIVDRGRKGIEINHNRVPFSTNARKVELNHSDVNRLQVWSLHSGPPKLIQAIT